jgi:drug/metabolite transporter (DMT)-like permease
MSSDDPMTYPGHPRIIAAAVAALGFWASAFVCTRIVVHEPAPGIPATFTPGELALYRYGVASITLALLAIWLKPPLPRRQDLPRLIATGAIGIGLYTLALNTGQQTTTAGAASFIVNTAPLFSTVFACIALKENLRPAGWLGLVVGLAGVGLIALAEEHSGISTGALLVFVAAIAWALYQIIQKPLLPTYGALGVVCWAIWIGTALFLPFAPGLFTAMAKAPLQHHALVIYLGVLPGALAFLAWSYLLAHLTVARATPLLYLVPVLSLAIAFVAIGEQPHVLSIIGGLVAIGGVALARFGDRPKATP